MAPSYTDWRYELPNSSSTATSHSDAIQEADRATELRDVLVDELRGHGKITSSAVEAAFRTLARGRFLPTGISLEVAYHWTPRWATKLDEHGVVTISWSTSAKQL